MKRILGVLVLVFVVVPGVFVVAEAIRTLGVLTSVERERDTWQRPDEIIRQLDLRPGDTVVDLGSGAGYFALKIASRVAPDGQVLAIDLRRQSLAFLWIRALLGGHSNLHVIHGAVNDPRLPGKPVDSVLIANTYHELRAPKAILRALFASMRSDARLVVVDRGPHTESETSEVAAARHEMPAVVAEREINQEGFLTIMRDERFIDRPPPEADVWWLMVFRKP